MCSRVTGKEDRRLRVRGIIDDQMLARRVLLDASRRAFETVLNLLILVLPQHILIHIATSFSSLHEARKQAVI